MLSTGPSMLCICRHQSAATAAFTAGTAVSAPAWFWLKLVAPKKQCQHDCLYSCIKTCLQHKAGAVTQTHLSQKDNVSSVICMLGPYKVRHAENAPASHMQQALAGTHLPQGLLSIHSEVVGPIDLHSYLLTCISPAAWSVSCQGHAAWEYGQV